MQHGLVVQAEHFFGRQGAGQGNDVFPAGVAFFRVGDLGGGQLLQQQATGAMTVSLEPEAGAQLFGHHEVVGEAFRQVDAVQRHDALIALALTRVDGQCQRAVRHQVLQAGARGDQRFVVTGNTTQLALA
ncbi:hypothetical protein ALP29_201425 [Pseudomonas syringae pv. avii]|uniref:Uncharacterized protein n=1 Tax=Pseudomonas syringae pv. avii TaxID=663959 RepID=A0A3M5W097_PSESX|nr:hypothetical protein ALP29_201425 [Pseudomonas syringae pv. avii]